MTFLRLRRHLVGISTCFVLVSLACSPQAEHSPELAAEETPNQVVAVEATSLLGRDLVRSELPEEFRLEQEQLLAEARADLAQNPESLDALIWVGRRTAYLGRYQESISIYTEALELHPDQPRLYRHRGHRYLTTREFAKAESDFERARDLVEGLPDRVEQDGLPNDAGIPTSTLQTNIWYHLGLARYLQKDFVGARDAYQSCLELSENDDMWVATAYWLVLAARRSGETEGIDELFSKAAGELEILENEDYRLLLRAYAQGGAEVEALLEGGETALASATRAYGVGAWLLLEGNDERARSIFEEIVAGESWAAFGYIAAEAELAP